MKRLAFAFNVLSYAVWRFLMLAALCCLVAFAVMGTLALAEQGGAAKTDVPGILWDVLISALITVSCGLGWNDAAERRRTD